MTVKGVVSQLSADATDILERMSEGFYAIDAEWRLIYVNKRAEEFWGRKRQDLLGHSMLELFPAFAGSPAHAAHVKALDEGRHLRVEVVSTATRLPVQLSLYPENGGLSVYFDDISSRVDLEKKLVERNELLTLAEMAAGIGLWDCDLSTGVVRGTPQYFRLHGVEAPNGTLPREEILVRRHPDDADKTLAGLTGAMTAGEHESEYRVVLPNGEVRWIFGRGVVTVDSEDRPVRFTGVDIDVSSRKDQEDQLRLMAHELRHRANNLLAVVQAMARQTLRQSSSLDEFAARFDGRVGALANSNDLLVHQDWRGVPLDHLVRRLVQPFADVDSGRLLIDGPEIDLSPKAVQTLGLALHELATNASKYGALSVPEGHVAVSWSLNPISGTGPMLHLRWAEKDGPPVAQPKRSGFGSFVVETMVAQSLEAAVAMTFEPDGFVWSVRCPAEAVRL